MVITVVLCLSVLLQFIAALLALRLIRVTGIRTAWVLIATALCLMAVRRSITLYHFIGGDVSSPPNLPAELVALVISVLMVTGVAWISSLFESIRGSEKALLRERNLVSRIMETSPSAITVVNHQGQITFANTRAEQILGIKSDEITKRTYNAPTWHITDYNGQSFPDDKLPFQQVLKTGRSVFDVRHAIERPDGQRVLLSINAAPLFDERGNADGIVATLEDFTQGVRAEEALRNERDKAQKYLDVAGVMLVAIDHNQNVTLINKRGCELLEYNEDEILGKNWFEHFLPERFREKVSKVFKELMTGEIEVVEYYENPVITKNGQEKLIAWHNTLLHDEKGRITGALSSGEDITKRKKAEERLRQSEEYIKGILESVEEGFTVVDREYRIITANRAYGDQCGIPVKNMIGRLCYEVLHHAHKPCYDEGKECPIKNTFETGEPQTVVHTHRDKEGNPVYVEIRSYPMKDALGNIGSVIEVTNDVTEKKRLEEQLRQSQKLEAIGKLAGGIAHDFNNILTAIIGYGNILQMKISEDDPSRVYVNQILSSSEKAANLTRSLLAFSRQQIIHPMPVKLNEIIERMEKLLLRLISEDIEFRTMLTDQDLTIMADTGQIEQVLMNLATNARDAMPEGGRLTIGTSLMKLDDAFIKIHGYDIKPGMYAVVTVTDTGEGMDESTRKRVFEPFFTTKELGRGTGLGLSIVYGIVSQHNGIIDVYSEPGRGTTFKTYLPLIKAGIEEAEEEALPPPKGGTETVLVAEDNKEVRELIRTVLDQFGYKVIEAVDGDRAVIKFNENRDKIDLAILDVVMPKKHGKIVYEEIWKVKPEIKAIFVSGYSADIIDKKGVLEEGVNFLQKPISPNDLLRKVREVLDS